MTDSAAGTPRSCGTPIPGPDLEAEAQRIDRELGIEFGHLVDRRAWAAGPPDGLLDSLFGWLPGAKRRHSIWRRGHELWTMRLDPERWSRCRDCAAQPPTASE